MYAISRKFPTKVIPHVTETEEVKNPKPANQVLILSKIHKEMKLKTVEEERLLLEHQGHKKFHIYTERRRLHQVSQFNNVQELKCPTGLISEIVEF
jgi:hypothetical protein